MELQLSLEMWKHRVVFERDYGYRVVLCDSRLIDNSVRKDVMDNVFCRVPKFACSV